MDNQTLERYINQWIVYETQQLKNQQVGNMPTTVVEILGEFEIKNNQRCEKLRYKGFILIE